MAQRFLETAGDIRPLGLNWMDGFYHRNPQVKTVVSVQMDGERVDGLSQPNIDDFLDRLKRITTEKNIKIRNQHNMDETGVAEGRGTNGCVVGRAEKKEIITRKLSGRLWTTILHSICADGSWTKPVAVFEGASLQSNQFPDILPNWFFTYSQNGWSSSRIALEWLERVFIPETAPRDDSGVLAPADWRLLILDGHVTHEDLDFMWKCYLNNIHLLFLPAYCSHEMQPLDKGVFLPLKGAYKRQIQQLASQSDSQPVQKARFVRCYSIAVQQAFTVENIKSAFRATGIVPLNPSKVVPTANLNPTVWGPEWLFSEPSTTATSPFSTPSTPTRGFEICRMLIEHKSVPRIKTRLIAKGLDILTAENAILRYKIAELEDQSKAIRPTKRRAVKMDENSKFADIRAIKAAQEAAETAAKACAEKEDAFTAQHDAAEESEIMEGLNFEDIQFNWTIDVRS
ncbi:hypothetical protein JX266_012615 [Neoarthrinium moseri]|nr:hypothetical protein JX266_012615 [Neoarthrinium moseri]